MSHPCPKPRLWENKGHISTATLLSPERELDSIHHLEPLPSGLTTRGHIQMEKIVKRVVHLHVFAYVCISTQEHVVRSQAIFQQM